MINYKDKNLIVSEIVSGILNAHIFETKDRDVAMHILSVISPVCCLVSTLDAYKTTCASSYTYKFIFNLSYHDTIQNLMKLANDNETDLLFKVFEDTNEKLSVIRRKCDAISEVLTNMMESGINITAGHGSKSQL